MNITKEQARLIMDRLVSLQNPIARLQSELEQHGVSFDHCPDTIDLSPVFRTNLARMSEDSRHFGEALLSVEGLAEWAEAEMYGESEDAED